MVDLQTLLDEALAAWSNARQAVIAELENLPDDAMGWRAGEGGRSVLETARHVAESAVIFSGELTRPDGDFWRAPFSALYQEYCSALPPTRTRAEVIELLRTTMEQIEADLRAAGPEHLAGSMRGITGAPGTRLATVHSGISHEFYHCGQIALCARALGVVPALTKRFQPA